MSYDSEVLADSPWGYWKLQDDVVDSSGNARDGTKGSNVAYADGPQTGTRGIVPGGGTNNTNDVVVCPLFNVSSGGTFTVEAWVYVPDTTESGGWVASGPVDGVSWVFGVGSGATLPSWGGGGNESRMYAYAIGDYGKTTDLGSGWLHVVDVVTAGSWLRYVDGSAPDGATGLGSTGTLATGDLRIGGVAHTGNNAMLSNAWRVSRVAVYTTALASGRVSAHYDARTAMMPAAGYHMVI
ncbi:MAG: hypothetical protein IPM45_18080 [Acidimicrobiales bacterium]|nr:hypothetical protein [Acidimicrobiales bacterium]